RRVIEADDLLHLEVRVGVEEVIVEHPARFEEGAILLEVAERLAQRAAHGGDLFELRRRQVVEVLVDGGAGIELVLDAVETRHQHGGKGEGGVGERIRIAHLDAPAFGRGGCGIRPSGCAPNRRARPAPRSPALAACRSWWWGW